MIVLINNILILLFFITFPLCMENKDDQYLYNNENNSSSFSLGRIGEYGSLPNPMNDRAKGFLLKGKVQSAVTNYGNFINWDYHPAALWGEYTYLPTTAFVAGVPGHSYTYDYEWVTYQNDPLSLCTEANGNFVIWCSYLAVIVAYTTIFKKKSRTFILVYIN